ncbi:Protein of unknown function [Mesorhizobium albiziae]|uniref:DUF1353 domain-containing protein n=1 Tax=Neomesorhizobium albiziae TaxID=335020 RepID=A0A1I4BYJ5_9HYPH|nr:DUF1353 domain-containing protein [Mesorhizobium albiziae]GLS29596.1 hypothetical protein GCM10007937_13040 [Mesorhizobium albiziae]SFK73725.1 Protein of unknown function [Mesorhizobium albiziae]
MSKQAFMREALKPNGRKDFVGVPQISPFADWDYYYMRAPFSWYDGSETRTLGVVEITTGFVCDLASIPRLFWTLLPKTAPYTTPAIVHDYLYWFQPPSHDRQRADMVLNLGMRELKVPGWKRWVIYRSVRLAGGWSWNKNKQAREAGERRILKKLPTDIKTTWTEWKRDPSVFM